MAEGQKEGRVTYRATRHSKLLAACLPQDVVSHIIYRMDPTFHRIAHSELMRSVRCSEVGMRNRRLVMRMRRAGSVLDDGLGSGAGSGDLGLLCMLEFEDHFERALTVENVSHYFREVANHTVRNHPWPRGRWYLRAMLTFMRDRMSPGSIGQCSLEPFLWPLDVTPLDLSVQHRATPASLAAYCGDEELCAYFQRVQCEYGGSDPLEGGSEQAEMRWRSQDGLCRALLGRSST